MSACAGSGPGRPQNKDLERPRCGHTTIRLWCGNFCSGRSSSSIAAAIHSRAICSSRSRSAGSFTPLASRTQSRAWSFMLLPEIMTCTPHRLSAEDFRNELAPPATAGPIPPPLRVTSRVRTSAACVSDHPWSTRPEHQILRLGRSLLHWRCLTTNASYSALKDLQCWGMVCLPFRTLHHR